MLWMISATAGTTIVFARFLLVLGLIMMFGFGCLILKGCIRFEAATEY